MRTFFDWLYWWLHSHGDNDNHQTGEEA